MEDKEAQKEEEKKENSIYCPICHGPVAETGKPTWAYCSTHGWVKYKSYKTYDEKESEDLLSKINLRTTILAKQAEEKIDGIRKKSPLLAYIVPALFVTILLAFLAGNFFWRDTAHKIIGTKQTEVVSQKELQVQENVQVPENQPSVSVSPDETVAVNEGREDKKEKEIKRVTLQSQTSKQIGKPQKTPQTAPNRQPAKISKPSKIVFTVQAGLFKSETNAKNLNKNLHEKGFDSSIITSKTQKGETLYRIYIGEFNERKKAEDLAQRVKKESATQAFVTTK